MAFMRNSETAMVCSYNGFTFPEYSVTTGLICRPVEDKAGRTIIYNEYTFSIRATITGTPTDASVIEARRRLTKNGGAFRYTGRGLGDISINVGGTGSPGGTNGASNSAVPRDVNYGPKCRELGFKFLGRRNACQIDWQVTVCVPDCSDAKYAFALMSLNYRVEFHQRRNGKVDRVVSGELMIPNNRVYGGSRQILDSPDNYREKVATPIPKGFRREYSPWVINEARTSLAFGWKDIEFDSEYFPEGCVEAKFSQSTRSRVTGPTLAQYTTTFRGEYELAPGYDVSVAQKAFFEVVKDRLDRPKTEKDRKDQIDKPNNNAFSRGWLPHDFSMDEPNMYGPRIINFSFSAFIMQSSIRDILKQSGIWRADPKSDWDKWHTSLKDTALHPRGVAKLTFKPNEDRIIDLCGDEKGVKPTEAKSAKEQVLRGSLPTASTGWLLYENNVYVESDTGIAELRQLPQDDLSGTELRATAPGGLSLPASQPAGGAFEFELRATPGAASPSSNLGNGFTRPTPGPPGAVNDPGFTPGFGPQGLAPLPTIFPTDADGFPSVVGDDPPMVRDEPTPVQKRTRPACYVIMHGRAIRAGAPVPCPELTKVEDIEPVLANRLDKGEGFNTGIIRSAGNIPIYGATWRLRYFLPETPDKPIVPPPNPMLGG